MSSITVVIASYYYAPFVAQALDSVVSQTRMPDKIFVVDDASADGAIETALAFKRYYKHIIECVQRNVNMGIVNNFDDMLRNKVKTDKVMFMGADNWLRPDALEKMEAANADIVSSDVYLVGHRGAELVRKRQKIRKRVYQKDGYYVLTYDAEGGNINRRNYIHGSSLYNVSMAQQFGYDYFRNKDGTIFDETRPLEDWQLWKNMLGAGAKHVHIPEPLLYYRRHHFNFLRS